MCAIDEREIVQLICKRLCLPAVLVSEQYARMPRFREICQDYVTTLQAWARWSVLDTSYTRHVELDYWETLQALEAEMQIFLLHPEQANNLAKGNPTK